MRLIDADELMRSIRIADKQDVLGLRDLIQNEETVHAIPWHTFCDIMRELKWTDTKDTIFKRMDKWIMENDDEYRARVEEYNWWHERLSRFD